MMARLAGDSSHYRMELIDKFALGASTGIGVDLISVTSAIHEVMSGSFAPASWWGYRVAAGAMLENDDIYGPEVEDLYQKLKNGGIHPNAVRDAAGDRGTKAHGWMEYVGKGLGSFEWEGDEPMYFVPTTATEIELDGWGKAGARWWRDYVEQGTPCEIISCEQPFFSLSTQSAGTADLLWKVVMDPQDEEPSVLEIVDWKTHKPASPMKRKLENGGVEWTPAYFEELLQLAAYRGMYEEMTDQVIPRQRVVIFRENGKYLEDERVVSPRAFFDWIVPLYALKQRIEKGV